MQYTPALTGLRAVAVTAVMLFHARAPGGWAGYFGVDVFFVLSGFLITSLLLAEYDARGSVNLPAFYWRRAVRLMPALVLMLLTYLVLAPLAWPGDAHGSQVAAAALYLSDYAIALSNSPPGQLSHTWSLAVEAQFYLLWPIVIVGLRRLAPRQVIAALAGLYLLAFFWRAACVLLLDHSWQQIYYRMDTRMTGLVLGALLCAVSRDIEITKVLRRYTPPVRWLAPIAGLLFLCHWGSPLAALLGFFLVELVTAAFLLYLLDASSPAARLLSRPLMVWLGAMSYGIYLWHYPIFVFLRSFGWEAAIFIGGPLSIGIAALSFYTIETWARRPARLQLRGAVERRGRVHVRSVGGHPGR